RHNGDPFGGLLLGATFAFVAMAVESAGDFGLHIPAIAVLATVLAAHLCAAGSANAREGKSGAIGSTGLRRGVGPVVGAALAVALGLLLCREGWTRHQVEQLRLTASRLGRSPDPVDRTRQLECLEQAARLAPGSAGAAIDLADEQFQRWR